MTLEQLLTLVQETKSGLHALHNEMYMVLTAFVPVDLNESQRALYESRVDFDLFENKDLDDVFREMYAMHCSLSVLQRHLTREVYKK